MKKILFIALFGLAISQAKAQTSPGAAGLKTMSIEEAIKLNGPANPTFNGKPYSQYKAEQEALNQRQNTQTKVVSPLANNNATNSNGNTPAVNTKPAVDQKQSGQSSTLTPPVVKEVPAIQETKPAVQPATKVSVPGSTIGGTPAQANTKPEPVKIEGSSLDAKSYPKDDASLKSKALQSGGSVGSTGTEKPVIVTDAAKTVTIEPAKTVKEPIPAALKGTSLDPDAKPVVKPSTEKPVVVPAQNSSNTQSKKDN
jgi:hypothetical protein